MGKRLYSFFSSLSDTLELPVTELMNESTAELTGRRECVFFGVKRICSFDGEKAVLLLCDGNSVITGERLRLVVFGGNAVRIKGNIGCISFGEGKK